MAVPPPSDPGRGGFCDPARAASIYSSARAARQQMGGRGLAGGYIRAGGQLGTVRPRPADPAARGRCSILAICSIGQGKQGRLAAVVPSPTM